MIIIDYDIVNINYFYRCVLQVLKEAALKHFTILIPVSYHLLLSKNICSYLSIIL